MPCLRVCRSPWLAIVALLAGAVQLNATCPSPPDAVSDNRPTSLADWMNDITFTFPQYVARTWNW